MTTPRFDMYTLVHKGQRKKLFELTIAAGQAICEELVADVKLTLDAIEEHARAEDEFLGPLHHEASPANHQRLVEQHADLDDAIAALRTTLRIAADDPTPWTHLALYRSLAAFTGEYLAHVATEERAMTQLWARFDDAALARAQGALVASHPPATVQFNLRNMLPAASSVERVALLGNLRRNMPAPAFAGLRASVASLVTDEEWEEATW